jgi:hypothetical protein
MERTCGYFSFTETKRVIKNGYRYDYVNAPIINIQYALIPYSWWRGMINQSPT